MALPSTTWGPEMEASVKRKKALRTPADVEAFFAAFNQHDYDGVFQYLDDDCIWNASEKRLVGRQDILDYWTKHHAAMVETLGQPHNIVFGDHLIFLEVRIRLDFIQDGLFYGKSYQKGECVEFGCADVYELTEAGTIKEGRVYLKFFR
jgi:hypothetical protein